jgi:hypothetical protein
MGKWSYYKKVKQAKRMKKVWAKMSDVKKAAIIAARNAGRALYYQKKNGTSTVSSNFNTITYNKEAKRVTISICME